MKRDFIAFRAAIGLSQGLVLLGSAGCFSNSSTSPVGPTSDAGALDGTSPPAEAGEASDGSLLPTLDAGPSCVSPGTQAAVSPSAEGLPASGLVMWLRADKGVYTMVPPPVLVESDATAGGPDDPGAAPAQVCAWQDLSGHGWLFENLTASAPTFVPAGLGGQPAIEFASTMASLQTSGVLGIGATSPRTFVAVEALVNADGRFDPIAQGETGSAGTYISIDANPYETAGNLEGVYMTSNAFDTATATMASAARVHVYTVSAMTVGATITASVDYRVNGVTQTLTLLPGGSDGTFQDFSPANFTAVGASFTSSTGVGPDGLVAEVLVYDRALSVAERASVEAALESRYGIR